MKKLCIFIFLMAFLPISFSVNASTGHEAFSSISLKEEGKLLNKMTKSELDQGYQAMGRKKFWGWKHHYFLIRTKGVYTGEVIFAKSNRTGQPIEVDYILQEKKYSESSWKITGSVSGKIKGKVQKTDLEGTIKADGEKKEVGSHTRFEETKFKVVVEPNHRIIFHITGDCEVTNGVSKKYVFGITAKKGAWEYIDVLTSYYELYEMEIKE